MSLSKDVRKILEKRTWEITEEEDDLLVAAGCWPAKEDRGSIFAEYTQQINAGIDKVLKQFRLSNLEESLEQPEPSEKEKEKDDDSDEEEDEFVESKEEEEGD